MATSNIVQIIIQATDSASNVFKVIGDNSDRMGTSVSTAMNKSAKDIAKAQTAVIGLKDSIVGSIGTMKGFIANFGMAGIGTSIVTAAKNWSESVYNLRRAIGSTAGDASELLAIGKYAGIGTEEAAMYFAKFGKAISLAKDEMQKAAAEGKRSNDVFSRLGISFDQINGKNVGEVFTLVADKMRNMADGADKDRIAMELFGRSGFQITEMMNLSKAQIDKITEAAQKNGMVLNDETVNGWHNLSKEIAAVTSIGQKWAIQIGNDMLPALQRKMDAVKSLTKGYSQLSDATRHLIGEGVVLIGEFAAVQIAFRATAVLIATMAPGIAAALTGPWGALVIAIGLALAKVGEYFSAFNREQAQNYKDQGLTPEYDENGIIIPIMPASKGMGGLRAATERASDREIDEARLKRMIPDVPTTYASPVVDGGFAAAEKAAEKLERANERAKQLMADLDRRIADDSGSAYETGMARITAEVTKMQNEVTQIGAAGGDTSGLADKIAAYQQAAADKVRKVWRQAWTDIKDQTALAGAQLIGDKQAQADIEYQIELDKIAKEKEARLKAIAVDGNDQEAKDAVEKWAKAEQNLAAQKRDTTKTDAKLKEYQNALEYDSLLVNLEGKTQHQVDALRQKDLAAEISYLQQKLQDASLNAEQRLVLQKNLNDAMNQQYQLDAYNYDTAFSVALRNIQNRQTNYAQIVEETWNQVYASAQGNLGKMVLKGENATKAIENFFQNMVQSIEEMFLKMWADKYIMGPLQQLFGQVLGVNVGTASGGGASKGLSSIPSSAEASPIQTFAAGGDNPGGWSIVGEEGPELAYFGDPAHIYTAGQSQAMLNPAAAAVNPNVNVTVINKTGQQVQVSQQASYDPATQSTLVQMVIDGVQNNVAGARDFFFGRG